MAQWQECKKRAEGALLLFRLGDFYEAFHDDALLLSKELDVTLTKRQETPMAGIPFHASDGYIDKLVEKGYRVAIAEQMEDPRFVKGIVKREIVRIVTPGTLIQSGLLKDKTNNFLSCVSQVGRKMALSILDLTTADFRVLEFEGGEGLIDELYRLKPSEILLSKKWHGAQPQRAEEFHRQWGASVQIREEVHFSKEYTFSFLLRHFQVNTLDGFGLAGKEAGICAAGALLSYVGEELNLPLRHIKTLRCEGEGHYMQIDRSTQRHLELFESLHQGKEESSLFGVIDHTLTPMGGRLLKQWLSHPLLRLEEIQKRQACVGALFSSAEVRKRLRGHLEGIRDLQRLSMRAETLCASPRDLGALRSSLEAILPLKEELERVGDGELNALGKRIHDLRPLVERLGSALVEAPPIRVGEGGFFKKGFHEEIDALRSFQEESYNWVAHYQARLREESQIKTLKVGYTKAFGYYIEISRGQAQRAPDFLQRKQTLVNAERFITEELKNFEYKMLHAEEQLNALEVELFTQLRREVASYAPQILESAEAVAILDCFCSLAEVAKKNGYVRPKVDEGDLFEVKGGRHPVIEQCLKGETYIPNDLFLNAHDQRLHIITGPNMAGKSTFIRQAALIAILAQMGAFVPASEAHVGLVDRVFSRIGSSDDLSRGQSTFMVEMTETANILNNATSRSLVILDEIGRGTSTYDGISIAWAVAEYLLTQKGKQAKTLFATHYWELTEMEGLIPGAVNYNVSVYEGEEGIRFLRKIVKGSTDKSYGIHVAKLAGLPPAVVNQARERLKKLEKGLIRGRGEQLSLFSLCAQKPHLEKLSSELKSIDPHALTPLQALQKIMEWKELAL